MLKISHLISNKLCEPISELFALVPKFALSLRLGKHARLQRTPAFGVPIPPPAATALLRRQRTGTLARGLLVSAPVARIAPELWFAALPPALALAPVVIATAPSIPAPLPVPVLLSATVTVPVAAALPASITLAGLVAVPVPPPPDEGRVDGSRQRRLAPLRLVLAAAAAAVALAVFLYLLGCLLGCLFGRLPKILKSQCPSMFPT